MIIDINIIILHFRLNVKLSIKIKLKQKLFYYYVKGNMSVNPTFKPKKYSTNMTNSTQRTEFKKPLAGVGSGMGLGPKAFKLNNNVKPKQDDISDEKSYNQIKSKQFKLKISEAKMSRVVPVATIFSYKTSKEVEIDGHALKITKPEELDSPLLGASGGVLCGTCHQDENRCPGHYGVISLPVTFIHPFCYEWVIKVLQCVCKCCSQLFLSDIEYERGNFSRYKGIDLLDRLAERSKMSKQCSSYNQKERKDQDKICTPQVEYDLSRSKKISCIIYRIKGEKDSKPFELEPEVVKQFFEILDEKPEILKKIGFEMGKPSGMFMSNIQVIPHSLRPSNYVESTGDIADHYLTKIYKEILQKITEYNNIESGGNKKDRAKEELYKSIEKLLQPPENNAKGTIVSKSLRDQINNSKHRKGLAREDMMGKRVNYCARSVLSGSGQLKFGEIFIPEEIARAVTVQEKVTDREEAARKIKEGKVNYLWKQKKNMKCKNFLLDNLQLGDIIERHLQDGDYVVFNRQPTLHRQSIMGYKVRIWKQRTIGLHISSTTPHNADYDGDEGNIHVPQTPEAIYEVKEIMNVKNCIMNSENNAPSLGVVYNGISAGYALTRSSNLVPREQLLKLTEKLEEPFNEDLFLKRIVREKQHIYLRLKPEYNPDVVGNNVKKEMVSHYTGKHLFSILLPDDFFYNKADVSIKNGILIEPLKLNDVKKVRILEVKKLFLRWGVIPSEKISHFNDDERKLVESSLAEWESEKQILDLKKEIFENLPDGDRIKYTSTLKADNDLLKKKQGCIEKGNLGASSNAIIQHLNKHYDTERVMQFITEATFILNQWVEDFGLTVGIKDILPTKETDTKVREEVFGSRRKINAILSEVKKDPLEKEQQEQQVRDILNKITKIGKDLASTLTTDNMVKIMALSGAKGSDFNIAQIIGSLGQQFLDGQRFLHQISNGKRCLPYFDKESSQIEARGFVSSSFFNGLKPAELFFHQAAGRVGLTNTAVKIRDCGDISHKMGKSMEDLTIASDGSVRNGAGRILQYVYGGDGFDRAEMLKVKFSDDDMGTDFLDLESLVGKLNSKYEEQMNLHIV